MSSRKPPSNSGDWDDYDIPTWDDSVPTPSGKTQPASNPQSSSGRAPYPDPLYDDYDARPYPPRPQSGSYQPPTRLSSRVPTRSTRPAQDPYRDPYSGYDDPYIDDPYASGAQYPPQSQPRPQTASQYDLYAKPSVDAGWDDGAYDAYPAERRVRTSRRRSNANRPSMNVAMPALADGSLAALFGVALLGLAFLIGLVWWGIGDLGDTIPWHLNASGDVDQWASSSTLWRIPFGVLMSLAIGAILGAFLWKRDRFAARFIVASMCIVQVLAWVAVVDQLW